MFAQPSNGSPYSTPTTVPLARLFREKVVKKHPRAPPPGRASFSGEGASGSERRGRERAAVPSGVHGATREREPARS